MRLITEEVTSTGSGGADINVSLGFVPDFVELTNQTTRIQILWSRGDATNTAGISVAAAGTRATISAGEGVSLLTGSSGDQDAAGTPNGITIDAASVVNATASQVIEIKAYMADDDLQLRCQFG